MSPRAIADAAPGAGRDVAGAMVRWAGLAGLVSPLLAGGISALLPDRSWGSVLTSALGALLTGGTLVVGAWAVRWLLQQDRMVVMPGAAMIALAQIALLLALVLVLRQQDWWDDVALAVGALVAAVASQVAMVLAYVTGRPPELEVRT